MGVSAWSGPTSLANLHKATHTYLPTYLGRHWVHQMRRFYSTEGSRLWRLQHWRRVKLVSIRSTLAWCKNVTRFKSSVLVNISLATINPVVWNWCAFSIFLFWTPCIIYSRRSNKKARGLVSSLADRSVGWPFAKRWDGFTWGQALMSYVEVFKTIHGRSRVVDMTDMPVKSRVADAMNERNSMLECNSSPTFDVAESVDRCIPQCWQCFFIQGMYLGLVYSVYRYNGLPA